MVGDLDSARALLGRRFRREGIVRTFTHMPMGNGHIIYHVKCDDGPGYLGMSAIDDLLDWVAGAVELSKE